MTKTIDPKKTKENKEKKTTLEDHSHIVKILSSKDLSHIGKNNKTKSDLDDYTTHIFLKKN